MIDGRLLGLIVAAGAVVVLWVARRRIRYFARAGQLDPNRLQQLRRELLTLLFACGVAVTAAMSAAVVAADRAGDGTMSALAWGGVMAGIIVAAGAAFNALSLWRGGHW